MKQLEVQKISVRFGGLTALSKVAFSMAPGEIVGLIGPNGAGKTTVFNVLTGVYKVTGGQVLFEGNSILNKRPHRILAMGIARTFQNIRLFGKMTALENAMVAMHCRSKKGVVGSVLRTEAQRREERLIRERAMEALWFMGVDKYADETASSLPYGLQRRLEIARALASGPRLLLLDEPAAGMNPAESRALMDDIARIALRDVNILMIEHDMKVIMGLCTRVICIDYGIKIAEGEPEEIQRNPKVVEAYLGK